MKSHEEMPVDLVRALLDYDGRTGNLFWRYRRQGAQSRQGIAGSKSGAGTSRAKYSICFNGRTRDAARVIWIWNHGAIPTSLLVEHIDHDRLNNRIENLRLVTVTENNRNQSMNSKNTSGVQGVHKTPFGWQAYITVNGKRMHLLHTTDKAKAVSIRKAAEVRYGFHPNHGLPRAA